MKKIWAFIWHQKRYYFPLSPGVMRMQWEHTTLKDKKPCGAVCRRATYHNIIILRFIVLGRHHLTLEGGKGRVEVFWRKKKKMTHSLREKEKWFTWWIKKKKNSPTQIYKWERNMIQLMNKKKASPTQIYRKNTPPPSPKGRQKKKEKIKKNWCQPNFQTPPPPPPPEVKWCQARSQNWF